jgi:hypothetical protein
MDDENCIWFHQTDGVRHRLIDSYRNSGEGVPQAPPRARCQTPFWFDNPIFRQHLLTAFSKNPRDGAGGIAQMEVGPISFMTGKYGKRSLKVLGL